ncbi:hypothetical protein EON66_07005 [archaeon]|nr:MAG: hypothetical protein EON66_07005 [archaeon]
MSGVEDDDVCLRADSLAALRAFLAEREAATAAAAREAEDGRARLATTEDWELSQFWYDETTSTRLAKELLRVAEDVWQARGREGRVNIACLSCPSMYKALRSGGLPEYVSAWVFEYDTRFAVFGADFVHYDYKAPLNVPATLHHVMDVIALDPPFLNADCLAGFTDTVHLLQRNDTPKLLLCSGAVMLPHARRLLGLRPTREAIGHADKRLQNPFALYVNYDASPLGGIDEEAEAAEAAAAASSAGCTA